MELVAMYRECMSVGKRVKLAREIAGLSQVELADACAITQQAVSKLERGDAVRSVWLADIAGALGVRAEWLAFGTGQMTSDAPSSPDDVYAALMSLSPEDRAAVMARTLISAAKPPGESE